MPSFDRSGRDLEAAFLTEGPTQHIHASSSRGISAPSLFVARP
jgi:hypothetical protein